MIHTPNPVTVGKDADVELRDGAGNFSFAVTNKSYLENGNNQIAPSHGFATMGMVDGVWRINFVHVYGAVIGAKGRPVKKETHFVYAFGFGQLDKPRSTYPPGYGPPQWLIDFVACLEARLNNKTGA